MRFFVLAFLLGFPVGASSQDASDREWKSFLGGPPPELEIPKERWINSSPPPRLEELRGKVVLLEFIGATW